MRRGGVLALRTLRQSGQSPSVAGSGARMLSTHVSVIGRASICPTKPGASVLQSPLTLTTAGLHWKTDETRLRGVFSSYGELEEAKLVTPEHSSTHLWASLVYSTFDEALEAASEMNGQELDGRLLRVSIVDPPAEGEAAPAAADK
ncbi:hypothetical protein PHYPSEUDO_006219 [Phytophthora pseudosyringae]|uniref:RRM domain-containing protein n=1 Tax=Phytophthora pseudosyringae TaxID=221518 RepID=A0A8T1VJC4_9STRA|nr:hypothetical protein PHYPSEUDO_006219 [Phytophthora pseudosyringae]